MFLIAYIVVGLLLGPSSLNIPIHGTLLDLSAQGFLFVAGLELSLRKLRQNFRSAAKISLGAFLLPFAVGMLAGPFITSSPSAGIILALALSISALPVIVQILKELKIYNSPIGNLVISVATICDILAWLIFLLVIPVGNRHSWLQSHWPILFFFIGLLISDYAHRAPKLVSYLLLASRWIFAPIFFIGVGTKIRLQESFDWRQFVMVFVLAILSKMIGVYAIARWSRFSKEDSSLMAIVLNARGAMEILYASVALSLGMIDERLFASLILMAVLSSVMAPIAQRLKSGWRRGP